MKTQNITFFSKKVDPDNFRKPEFGNPDKNYAHTTKVQGQKQGSSLLKPIFFLVLLFGFSCLAMGLYYLYESKIPTVYEIVNADGESIGFSYSKEKINYYFGKKTRILFQDHKIVKLYIDDPERAELMLVQCYKN